MSSGIIFAAPGFWVLEHQLVSLVNHFLTLCTILFRNVLYVTYTYFMYSIVWQCPCIFTNMSGGGLEVATGDQLVCTYTHVYAHVAMTVYSIHMSVLLYKQV